MADVHPLPRLTAAAPLLAVLAVTLCTRIQAREGADAESALTTLTRLVGGHLAITEDVRRQLQDGAPVSSTVAGVDGEDVSALGAIHLDVPAREFVRQFRDIEHFERGKRVLQIGRVAVPPVAADLAALTLDPVDVESLRACRPADCDVQLPAIAIDRTRAAAAVPDAQAAAEGASGAIRDFLLDLTRRYLAVGAPALGAYDDRAQPMPLADAFGALLDRPATAGAIGRDVRAYFDAFPRAAVPGAETLFYWSKIDLGLKPTIRLNHAVILPHALAAGPHYVIATRQLYATHYFDAALEMRWLIDDAPGANRGCYFVYATFVRSRALGGMLGALLRGRVRGQARTALEKYLAVTKDAVERTAADQPAPSTSSSAAPRSSAFRAPMP